MSFELVSIIFAIVPGHGNEYMTKENKNWNSLKNFAPKHKYTYTYVCFTISYSLRDFHSAHITAFTTMTKLLD